jgi:hypothetical protein
MVGRRTGWWRKRDWKEGPHQYEFEAYGLEDGRIFRSG